MKMTEISDRKAFTSSLFLGGFFDELLLVEAAFTTYAVFTVDGRLQRAFFDSDEQDRLSEEDFIFWKQAKDFCFSVIRGKRPPLQFRVVLQLPASHPFCSLHPDLAREAASQNLYLNIQYRDQSIICTSGSSSRTFVPGTQPGRIWDDLLSEFLKGF